MVQPRKSRGRPSIGSRSAVLDQRAGRHATADAISSSAGCCKCKHVRCVTANGGWARFDSTSGRVWSLQGSRPARSSSTLLHRRGRADEQIGCNVVPRVSQNWRRAGEGCYRARRGLVCAMLRRPSSVTKLAPLHIDVPLPCRNVHKRLGMAGICLPSARGAAAKRLGRSRGDLFAADDTFTWWLGWAALDVEGSVGLMTERQVRSTWVCD